MKTLKLDLVKDSQELIRIAHLEDWFDSYIPVLQTNEIEELEEEGGITVISTKNLITVVEKLGSPRSAEVAAQGNILFYFDSEDHYNLPPVYLATGFAIGYRGEGPSGLATFLSQNWDLNKEETLTFVSSLPIDFRGVIMSFCTFCQ